MSVTAEDFQEMKRVADEAERKKNMALGQKAAILKRLKEEFGCADAKAGKALLAKKTAEAEKLERKLDEAKEAFMEAHGDGID